MIIMTSLAAVARGRVPGRSPGRGGLATNARLMPGREPDSGHAAWRIDRRRVAP